MSAVACVLWWLTLGALVGWLASWLVGRLFKPAPVERIVDRPIDRIVEKLVDNPAHVSRIKGLEGEVALIEGLRRQIADLQARPPQVVEKIVEKLVDNPAHVARVQALETEVAAVPGLRRQIAELQATPPRIVEKIVEKPVERIVEKVVDRVVPVDVASAKAAGFRMKGPDDLEIIEGIGPKIAELLKANGISTFQQLADTTPAHIQSILDEAGPTFRIANPGTWPEQSDLAARNRWTQLQALQATLVAGVRVEAERGTAQVSELQARLAERDAEIQRLTQPVAIDVAAAKGMGFGLKGPDDLEIIEGIGPKIAQLLKADGITTFAELARTTPEHVRTVLDKAGPQFQMANPMTWPEQAELAARNQWRALKALQSVLTAGNA